jgi:hypothetical protein
MNHIKLYEEFSEEDFGDLGFDRYSLYFVEVSGYEKTVIEYDPKNPDDEYYGFDFKDDPESGIEYEEYGDLMFKYQHYKNIFGIVCKDAEEFYDEISWRGGYNWGPSEFEIQEYQDFIDDNRIKDENEYDIIRSMSGKNIYSREEMSRDDEYRCDFGEILGPFTIIANKFLCEKYPFKPGSEMSKYAAPYMNLPEVKALLSSFSK